MRGLRSHSGLLLAAWVLLASLAVARVSAAQAGETAAPAALAQSAPAALAQSSPAALAQLSPAPAELADVGPRHAYSSQVDRAWFESGRSLRTRAAHTRRVALALGAPNVEAAARALIAPGLAEERLANAALAVRLAPDLPVTHLALAGAQWQEGEYRLALLELADGCAVIARHPEASAWLVGSLLVMFATVLVAGSFAFVLCVGFGCFSHAAHDAGDLLGRSLPVFAGVALVSAGLLVPIALGEGAFGFLLGCYLLAFLYAGSRYRMALSLAAILAVLGLYPVLELAGTVLTALDSDPVASAALAVVRGDESPPQVEVLERAAPEDLLAAQALAVQARRRGDTDAARGHYERLLEQTPRDPVVLTNLANLLFAAGETVKAIELYERAAAVEASALLMFDLSQAYARAFRMQQFEAALQRAQAIDAEVVAELSGFEDPEFVADLPIPMSALRERMLRSPRGASFSPIFAQAIAPGWLGRGWLHTAAGFAVANLVGLMAVGRYQQASRCERCRKRICARCDDDMWNSELCDACHHLFQRSEGTDPALRMARLKELRARESRAERLGTAVAVLVPGVAGMLARRPDLSFLGILFFASACVLIGWRDGIVSDPLAVGAVGPLAFVIAGAVMLGLHVAVLISGLILRRSL